MPLTTLKTEAGPEQTEGLAAHVRREPDRRSGVARPFAAPAREQGAHELLVAPPHDHGRRLDDVGGDRRVGIPVEAEDGGLRLGLEPPGLGQRSREAVAVEPLAVRSNSGFQLAGGDFEGIGELSHGPVPEESHPFMKQGDTRRDATGAQVMPTAPSRLIVFAGLPGVGKSTLAREVAGEIGAPWLRVDTIEASLLRAGLPQSFETGLAAYLAAGDVAQDQLRFGGDVVIDAVNGVEPARAMWRDLAHRWRARLFVIEVTCPDPSEHQRRVESRGDATPPLPAPTWSEVTSREYLPWHDPVLSVDGTRPVRENVARILGYCSSAELPAGPPPRERAPP